MGMIRRRWRVVRYSKVTGNLLPPYAFEARRRFWTFLGANAEARRLRAIADSSDLPYSFRASKTG